MRTIKIKYLRGVQKIERFNVGDWIDLRAAEEVHLKAGEYKLIPLGVVAYYALTDPDTGAFTWSNILELGTYLPVFGQSISYSLISAFICLLLGYPVAYYIAHRGPVAQKFLYMLVMLPMWMNFLLRTYSWMTILEDNGLLTSGLNYIVESINNLSGLSLEPIHLINTRGAVVLGMVYNFLPYMILPIYTVMLKADHSLVEAAQDLGCTPFQAFYKVVLPAIMPGIISGLMMAFTLSIDDFIISYFLSGTSSQTLPIRNFSMTKRRVTPDMYALSTLIFLAILVLLVVSNVISSRGDKKSAKKGGAK